MSKRLALLVLASGYALAASACGSSGGGIRVTTDGGAVFDFAGGGGGDMATSPLPDFATPPPDLSQAIDLSTPPDLALPPGNCAAGRYSGAINANAVGTPLTGTISFTLGPAQNGVLPVTTGKVAAMDQMGLGLTATADVTGSLDCNGRSFSGMMVRGVVQPVNIMFTGTLTADYNGGQRTFTNGMLSIQALMGNGTWSAAFLGP